MKEFLLALILLASSNVAFAEHDEWTADDTKRQAVYLVLHTIDWGQTRNIANNPKQYYEINPVIGEHPTTGRVNGYFLATALLHTGIAYVLPADWRKSFQYVTIVIEAGVTNRNRNLGVKIDF